jgi:hypothetical protein
LRLRLGEPVELVAPGSGRHTEHVGVFVLVSLCGAGLLALSLASSGNFFEVDGVGLVGGNGEGLEETFSVDPVLGDELLG